MKWASTVSTEADLEPAVQETTAAIRVQLNDCVPDFIIAFVSQHHQARFEDVPALIHAELRGNRLIGCSAGGVIGGGREIEQQPGLSLTAAILPDVELMPFHLDASAVPPNPDHPHTWEQLLGVSAERSPHFLLLPDPFTFDSETFLGGFDRAFPFSRKVGGLASGGSQPGVNALFLDRRVHRAGLVGVALTGNVEVETIVAQGCRPIGQPMFVTKCQRNFLWELDGRPAVEVLQDLYVQLDPSDQELARHALFLGIVMKEDRQEYRQGDFLIRNLMGMDQTRTALAIGAWLEENSVVQFHLRDAQTSALDLEQMLARYRTDHAQAEPHGALLFSCLGRGAHLYGRPDHDTAAFRLHLGNVPLGGFFCNGEIGPVHGTTFLHGYTSSFGLFCPRR